MRKPLGIRAVHPALGEVTILRILPRKLPVTLKEPTSTYEAGLFWPNEDPVTDELFHRTALVINDTGRKSRVPLRELRLNGKPLIQRVLDHEQIERYKASRVPRGQQYLHSHYGLVEVIKRYTEHSWLCRIVTGVDVIPDTQLVSFDWISTRHRLPIHEVKEFLCHPSELVPVESIKHLQPKDEHLYVAYSDVGAVAETRTAYKTWRRKTPSTQIESEQQSAYRYTPPARRDDVTMKSIDEFLRVLLDLPRVVKTKKFSGPGGKLRTVRYRETPRVLARGEDTGRLYITPAWWLWRVTGTFKVNPYPADGENGKIAERYQWQDPLSGSLPPEPPGWFSFDPVSEDIGYDGFLMDLPEIIPDHSFLSRLLERKAWYWKLPPRTAREFSISGLRIKWQKPVARSPLAIISLRYKEREYRIPVHISSKNELSIRVKSRELQAFLCRYVTKKLYNAFHGRPL